MEQNFIKNELRFKAYHNSETALSENDLYQALATAMTNSTRSVTGFVELYNSENTLITSTRLSNDLMYVNWDDQATSINECASAFAEIKVKHYANIDYNTVDYFVVYIGATAKVSNYDCDIYRRYHKIFVKERQQDYEKNTITIRGYDAVSKLESYKWFDFLDYCRQYNIQEILTGRFSIATLMSNMCLYAGITHSIPNPRLDLSYSFYTLDEINISESSDMNLRQILNIICVDHALQMAIIYSTSDYEVLTVGQSNGYPLVNLPVSSVIDLQYISNKPIAYNKVVQLEKAGVICEVDCPDEYLSTDYEYSTLYIDQSPFWSIRKDQNQKIEEMGLMFDEENIGINKSQIYPIIMQYKHTPLLSLICGANITDGNTNVLLAQWYGSSWNYDGGLRGSLDWSFLSTQQHYDTTGNFIENKFGNLELQVNYLDNAINAKCEGWTSDFQNQLKHIAEMNITEDTIKNTVRSETQTLVQQVNNQADVLAKIATETETKLSDDNFAINVKNIISETGVSEVTTETNYTFDKDGLRIAKTDGNTISVLDDTGLSVTSKGGDTLLTAQADANGSSEVHARNLVADTFLRMGNFVIRNDVNRGGIGFYYYDN